MLRLVGSKVNNYIPFHDLVPRYGSVAVVPQDQFQVFAIDNGAPRRKDQPDAVVHRGQRTTCSTWACLLGISTCCPKSFNRSFLVGPLIFDPILVGCRVKIQGGTVALRAASDYEFHALALPSELTATYHLWGHSF